MTEIVSLKGLSEEEIALAVFAQGVLNRKGMRVLLDCDIYKCYVGEPCEMTTVYDLIYKYAREFSGAVVYDLDENDVSVNIAATICAAGDYLGVPRGLINVIDELDLVIVKDVSDYKGTRVERQRTAFYEYKDKLNNIAVVHQVVREGNFLLSLRDHAIKDRLFCFYTGETEKERAFRREVLGWLKSCSPVFGWNDDEIAFIKDISSFGCYAVPTDWSFNHSYFKPSAAEIKQRVKRKDIAENKHYAAFVVSDGDNVQWLERDFSTTGNFGQRQKSVYDYKLTWTVSPSLFQLCPPALERIYGSGKHDYFISGVSGAGYMNPLAFPADKIQPFVEKTAYLMRQTDLSVVCLLDDINNVENEKFVSDRLSSYAASDIIKGGIYELDPDRYGSGKGRIFWAGGKPFVSVRFSLWHPTGNTAGVDKRWLDGIAREINGMPVDPHAENGYSVIKVFFENR